jgi:hypothetical protein
VNPRVEILVIDPYHLKLIPHSPKYSDSNGRVPITNDILVPIEVANSLGFATLIIKRGIYQANFKEGQFGSVIVNIRT